MVTGNQRGAGRRTVASRLTPPGCLPRALHYSRCSGVIMLDKPEDSTREAVARFFTEVCVQLAQFAKVPPDLTPEEIDDCFHMALFDWHGHASAPAKNFYLKGLLSSVKRDAAALSRTLEKLNQYHERTARRHDADYDLDQAAFGSLPPPNITHMLQELSALKVTAERLHALPHDPNYAVPGSQGRRPGLKHYPGLGELVFNLELSALGAGGGFSAHRKHGHKGNLILALDWLRDHLLARGPELKRLADLLPKLPDFELLADILREFERLAADSLPPKGKHPVAFYERALETARKTSRRWESREIESALCGTQK
jgi:hypothetical protein